ncbi:MAG: alpha-glucosidase/alpha-galactosidase [Lachnospiraceae bacterium]|nr:alpha-glucosidase/alpha-galactosidase [Lachnospiraceae bacterium]
MNKFTFIGAGSFEFTRDLIRDLMTFPAFDDCELMLMDIDEKKLEYARRGAEKVVRAGGHKAVIKATTDRREALENADGVLITVLQGTVDVWRHDIEIPKKYGVDICVGDTRGPSGIFRFLRTAPVLLSIIRDAEELCPNAVILNYTNPMAMLVSYLQSQTKLSVTGLCHSVQGTAEMLSEWLGLKPGELDYTCVGINHQAFYLKLSHNGEDMYPRLRELVKKPEIYEQEMVRNEMFKYLGYYASESSGHNSEYNPWFRKRPDLIEKYCTHGTRWNPGEYAFILKEHLDRENTWEKEYTDWLESGDIDLERGDEYASNIFNALYGDHTPFPFNANLRNKGYVTNIDEGACVEVPVIVDKDGIHVKGTYTLPDNICALVSHSAKLEEMAVKAAIEGDPEWVFQAVLQDPLTQSVCSMEEIHNMVQEMLDKNKEYLGYFKSLKLK